MDFLIYIIYRDKKYKVENRVLFLDNLGIRDLSEIENLESLTDLEELLLDNNQISEIKGLETLTNLKELSLDNNQISEIKGLESLTELEILSLSNNQISEIKGLETLTDLKELSLDNNQISEIKGLESLTELEILSLSNNQISEIKGLEMLNNLYLLFLGGNKITEIKGFENLINLQIIYLNNNQIPEIKGLKTLKNLKALYLNGNQISEIDSSANLINLQALYLGNNFIKEIKGFDNLLNLKLLSLFHNQISEIKGLEKLTNLQNLYLGYNQINEIKGLNTLKNLTQLNLGCEEISDIKGLENLTNLEILFLNKNNISEIKGLERLINLKELYLDDNSISEIKGLEKLMNLEVLEFHKNQITEIKGLENLSNLYYLGLTSNPLKGIDEFFVRTTSNAGKILELIRRKERGEFAHFEFYDESISFDAKIEKFKIELQKLEESDFINIGTYKENKNYSWKQNQVFFEQIPDQIKLSEREANLNRIKISLIQIHSLKGIQPPKNNKFEHFSFFIKRFWDKDEIENNNVLTYNKLESRVKYKIEEMFDLSCNDDTENPDLIIFPENSIPYNQIEYLKKFSEKYNLIIIGGLEHKKLNNDSKYYINQAIIIDRGNIGTQVKQTPVRIYNRKKKEYIQEQIECQKLPKVKIFETRIGKIAIFICKDFLRLSEKVSDWARKNKVDFIVIPSLTSIVLPFYSKLINILNYTDYSNLKILFNNIGEFGGSEFFSIDKRWEIETNFRNGHRDNIGENIVIREFIKKLPLKFKYDLILSDKKTQEFFYKIIKETGLSQEELQKKMDMKKASLKDLISDQGALFIIAKELGVDLQYKKKKLTNKKKMKIFNVIIQHTGLSKEELEKRIEDKKAKLKGLISDDGALFIIAKEFGINI